MGNRLKSYKVNYSDVFKKLKSLDQASLYAISSDKVKYDAIEIYEDMMKIMRG